MKFADNPKQAAEFLRQAVPLMVKFSIPPNPLNYSLWYAYVSQGLPELNKQMDKALDTYGTCPNVVSEQLFREHLIKEEVENAEDIQNALLSVMGDLETHASTTAQDTEAFNDILQDSLSALRESESDSSLENIIQRLADNTQTISESTRQFQQRIDEAQAEINALKKELEQTRQDATIDPLTGLFNRRVFDKELAQQAERTDVSVSLVMVDIDHFSTIPTVIRWATKCCNMLVNSSKTNVMPHYYRYVLGDKVLQYVGKLIKASFDRNNVQTG